MRDIGATCARTECKCLRATRTHALRGAWESAIASRGDAHLRGSTWSRAKIQDAEYELHPRDRYTIELARHRVVRATPSRAGFRARQFDPR